MLNIFTKSSLSSVQEVQTFLLTSKPHRSEKQFIVCYLRAMFFNEIAICSSLEVNNSLIWPFNFPVRLKLFPCLISPCRLCVVPLLSSASSRFNWRWIADWDCNSNVSEAPETFKMPINRIERIVVRGGFANLLCKRLCKFKFQFECETVFMQMQIAAKLFKSFP